MLRATAPFVYVRLHGPDQEHLYAGSYSDDDLRLVGGPDPRVGARGHEVYVYFNNDGHGHAVHDARRLRARLG